MIFKPELAELVLTGRKTQTRRRMSDNPRSPWFRERCAFQVGNDYAVQEKRGGREVGRILIEQVRAEPLGHITDADARAEGFTGLAEFEVAWEKINGPVLWDEIVWVLTFRPDNQGAEERVAIDSNGVAHDHPDHEFDPDICRRCNQGAEDG